MTIKLSKIAPFLLVVGILVAPFAANASNFCLVDVTDPTKCVTPKIECAPEEIFNWAVYGPSIGALCDQSNSLKNSVKNLSDFNSQISSTQETLQDSLKNLEDQIKKLRRSNRKLRRDIRNSAS